MRTAVLSAVLVAVAAPGPLACTGGGASATQGSVQLGPRPFYLVQGMDEGKLKDRLLQCKDGPFYRTDFSIGHRGAALQFPEHTDVAYRAGARMGAGIVECDVTFTEGRRAGLPPQRVRPAHHHQHRRHRPQPEVHRALDRTRRPGPPAPQCCTSDLTLAEFKTLQAQDGRQQPGRHHGRGLPRAARRAGAPTSTRAAPR